MIESKSVDKSLIRNLYDLANTKFFLFEFKEIFESNGWRLNTESCDEFGFKVEIENQWPLTVDPCGNRVVCAFLPICYWDTYNKSWHNEISEYEQESNKFNCVYTESLKLAIEEIGRPNMQWVDKNVDKHKASVWNTRNGALILQQACFDPQFGIEVNFWLNSSSITFVTPLIDGLIQHSHKLHEKQGFPELDWRPVN